MDNLERLTVDSSGDVASTPAQRHPRRGLQDSATLRTWMTAPSVGQARGLDTGYLAEVGGDVAVTHIVEDV